MAKAQQAAAYRMIPGLMRKLREDAGLKQRELGAVLGKPQSWIYNCETANRRVDITEFILWIRACGADVAEVVMKVEKAIGRGKKKG